MPSQFFTKSYGRCRKLKERREKQKLSKRIMRIEKDMKEIRKDQDEIERGQKQFGQRLAALKSACQRLRQETEHIVKQSGSTRKRLALMFAIVNARQKKDLATASHLARLLRSEIASN